MRNPTGQYANWIAIVITAYGLVTWLEPIVLVEPAIEWPRSLWPWLPPLCFFLTGTALWVLLNRIRNSANSYFVRVVASMLLLLAASALGLAWQREQWFPYPVLKSLSSLFVFREMGIVTSFSFGLVGLALWLLTLSGGWHLLGAQIIALLLAAVAATSVSQYLFWAFWGVSSLEQTHAMPLLGSIAFFGISVGILQIQPHAGLMQPLTSPEIGGVMARRLLPWAIILPIVIHGLIMWGTQLHLYSHVDGSALAAAAMLTTMSLLIWSSARTLNRLSADVQMLNQQVIHVLESTTDGVVSLDRQWRYIYVNAQAEQILRRSRQDLLGKGFWQTASCLTNPSVEPAYYRAMGEQIPVEFEIEPTSSTVVLEVRAFPHPLGITIYFRDVSQRQQLERDRQQLNKTLELKVAERTAELLAIHQQLQISEARLRTAQQVARMGSWEYDVSTGQVIWSTEVLHLLGRVPPEQALSYEEQIQQFYTADSANRLIAALRQAITTGEPYHLDLQAQHTDGSTLWLEAAGEVLRDPSGQVVQLVGTVKDITHRRQLETQLQLQTEREQLLSKMVQRIRQSLDLDQVLEATVAEVQQLLLADRVLIYQFQPDWSGRVRIESVEAHCSSILHQLIYDPCFAESKAAAYINGRVAVIADVEQADLLPCYLELLKNLQVRANLVVPIVIDCQSPDLKSPAFSATETSEERVNSSAAGGCLWGLLIAHQCHAPRQWQTWEMDLLEQLAGQVGIAIKQAQLYERLQYLNAHNEALVSKRTAQLQESLQFEALLRQMTDRVRKSLDEQQILQTAVQALAQLSQVNVCYMLLQTSEQVFAASNDAVPTPWQDETLRAHLFRLNRQPELQNQLSQHPSLQCCDYSATGEPIPFTLLASLIADETQWLGYLWLVKSATHCFSEMEMRLVQQVANHCAIALRQSRLYQAAQAQVKELKRLNQLKDDFLSTVSHELRTPMSNIKMSTQMLELLLFGGPNQTAIVADDSIKLKQYFQILQDEIHCEISLINDLLDLSRLDAESESITLTTIDLRPWLEHLAEPYVQRALQQQQVLCQNISQDLPPITTDLAYLARILTELLNNACKYTPAQGVITLGATLTATSGDEPEQPQLTLRVSNSGVEIPDSELGRVFDRFYRIPNNDPWKHGGTGLGLALVKKLAECLGGKIWAESGNGSTHFILRLPLVYARPVTHQPLNSN